MPKRSEVNVGDRFGPFTILNEVQRTKWDRRFIVDCECGKTHELPLKEIKRRKACFGDGPIPRSNSQVCKLLQKYPEAYRYIKRTKVYELWVSIRQEYDASVCERWDDLISFVEDFAELMGGEPIQYLQKRTEWVYYTIERIDKEGIWEPSNVTVRKFFSERAFHKKTYEYWRLLGSRKLLPEEIQNSYILFITTFGEKQTGYVLRRRDPRQRHGRNNSFWFYNGREHYIKHR